MITCTENTMEFMGLGVKTVDFLTISPDKENPVSSSEHDMWLICSRIFEFVFANNIKKEILHIEENKGISAKDIFILAANPH